MAATKITGMKKRQAIDKASQAMLLWVVAASVMVSVLLVGAQFFYKQFAYNVRVTAAKNEASQTLNENLENIEELKKNFQPIEKGAIENVDTGKILSALPNKVDPSALGTSLQKVFAPQSGVTLNSIEIESAVGFSDEGGELLADQSETNEIDAQDPSPKPIEATVVATGSYDQIAEFVQSLERSLRPITINSLSLSGGSTSLRATIRLTTYYQLTKDFVVIKEELPR